MPPYMPAADAMLCMWWNAIAGMVHQQICATDAATRGREAEHNATVREESTPPFPEARLKPSWQKYQRLAIGC